MSAAAKVTVLEAVRSLTGYDEEAIEAQFGAALGDLPDTRMLRALMFARYRHEGMPDGDALKEAMTLTLGALDTCFRDEGEESEGND